MLTCCKRVRQSPLDSAKPAIARLVLNALYRDWILSAALCAESVSDIKEFALQPDQRNLKDACLGAADGSQIRDAHISMLQS
jgi:hypothetical protein